MNTVISYQQITKVEGEPVSTLSVTGQKIEIPETDDADEVLSHVTFYLRELPVKEDTEFRNVKVEGIQNQAVLFVKKK